MHRHDDPSGGPDHELFRRLVDQQLSSEEFAAFEERLLVDQDFRARYVQYIDLEASLYDELLTPWAAERPCVAKPLPRSSRKAARIVGWSMLASIAAALLVGAWLRDRHDVPSGGSSGDGYVEIPLRGMEAVAIVTHAEGLGPQRQAEVKPGMRLKPGLLRLAQGRVQLEFLGGAKLLVQGPCELHILSPMAATLVSGKAAARVLEWGRGFVLNTPDAVLVDLGTEFAVGVDERQGSEVQVVRGEVEISVLGEDGSTLTSEIVEEANAMRIRPGATSLEPDKRPRQPLRVFDDPPRPLTVPDSYVRTVRQARPTLYWRFESQQDRLVPNEAGPQFAARLQLDKRPSSAIRIADGQLHLGQSKNPRYVTTNEPLPTLNADSFSIELWVNPAMLHWATLVAIVPDGDFESETHLNVIELVHQTALVHEAGAFRFMHRYPPSETGGTNLFTRTGCTPGRWHHLVAVKTPQELRLYLNGQLTRHLKCRADSMGRKGGDDSLYHVHLGGLRTSSDERQFVGSIDELAIYPYALNGADIERHYRLLVVAGID